MTACISATVSARPIVTLPDAANPDKFFVGDVFASLCFDVFDSPPCSGSNEFIDGRKLLADILVVTPVGTDFLIL